MGKPRHDTDTPATVRVSDLLRAPAGGVDLHAADARATPGFDGGKAAARALQPELAARLSTLQEQLYAEGRHGSARSVLLVLQGMDTSGKGGTVRHVLGQVDPSGVHVASFGPPTPEELRHPFLWRIRRQLPRPGQLGVFDRSHYEDVVAARVRGSADRRAWSRRYGAINRFEADLAAGGTRLVKCFLHISAAEQRERLLARLDDPTKHWKFNPGDLADRELWEEYLVAYGDAIARCSTEPAPWYVVPADRKWYRNHAITQLLIEQLEELALRWPEGAFDADEQRERLLALP
jgi:PPK2 family polyphosphate:nucleotide phosphotransferase